MSDSLSLLGPLPDGFVSNFAKALSGQLKTAYPSNLAGINATALSTLIQTKIRDILPVVISLSKARPDFESALVQLMNEVERNGIWSDADMSSTGMMVLRAIATDIDYGQFAISRALQEAYLPTAQSANSVYLAARTLGERLIRNKPARVEATMSRLDNAVYYEAAAYHQFLINDSMFFNRDPIIFLQNQNETTVVFHQGRVRTTTITSSGLPYQTIEVGSETWNLSDEDIRVKVDGIEWRKVDDPLWNYGPRDTVYYETTLQNGNIEIRFGNGITGASPAINIPIEVLWVETAGADGNSVATGQKVSPYQAETDIAEVVGTTTTPITDGENHKDMTFYRLFASNRRAAQKRAVRRSDYRAHAVEFPGVIDARFRGQAELNPKKPSWTNIIGATLLTDPAMSSAQWTRFTQFMAQRGIYQTKILRMDPQVIPYSISARIFCRPEANLAQVEATLRKQVTDAMRPQYNSLGYSRYLSDFDKALRGKGPISELIEYIELDAPTADVVVQDAYQWCKLTSLTLTMNYTRRVTYEGRIDQNPLNFDDISDNPIT